MPATPDPKLTPNHVVSNQQGIHEKLSESVKKHLQSPWLKPISEHTRLAFVEAQAFLNDHTGELILDSCCGTGESTVALALKFPDARVLGVDKSALRVDKHSRVISETDADRGADNYKIIRADLNDFWRLLLASDYRISQHYLLYPNPYPKASQFNRRWHGSPAFSALVALGGRIEVRSNWKTYIEEFELALTIARRQAELEQYQPETVITAFERKFHLHGQPLWRVVSQAS